MKRSQELTASPQDQTTILSFVTKVTNAFDAIIVQTQTDVQIEEYRQVRDDIESYLLISHLYIFKFNFVEKCFSKISVYHNIISML